MIPENSQEFAAALLRASAFCAAAYIMIWVLLTYLEVRSARVHTVAWLGVLIQGLVLVPFAIEVPAPSAFAAAP
jgi:hypothetical protein